MRRQHSLPPAQELKLQIGLKFFLSPNIFLSPTRGGEYGLKAYSKAAFPLPKCGKTQFNNIGTGLGPKLT